MRCGGRAGPRPDAPDSVGFVGEWWTREGLLVMRQRHGVAWLRDLAVSAGEVEVVAEQLELLEVPFRSDVARALA